MCVCVFVAGDAFVVDCVLWVQILMLSLCLCSVAVSACAGVCVCVCVCALRCGGCIALNLGSNPVAGCRYLNPLLEAYDTRLAAAQAEVAARAQAARDIQVG